MPPKRLKTLKAAQNAEAPRPSFRKSSTAWKYRHRITDDTRGEPLILVPGEYPYPWDKNGIYIQDASKRPLMPYYTFYKHTIKLAEKKYRSFICSAGLDNLNQQPCLGCYIEQKGDRRSKRGLTAALTAVSLMWYHKVPQKDDSGQVRTSESGEPYTNLEKCTGPGCPHCAAGYEKVFGRRVYLELGTGHLDDLVGIEEGISQQCPVCTTPMDITYYVCPECGASLIDCRQAAAPPDILATAASRPTVCPDATCPSHNRATNPSGTVIPEPYLECGNGCEFGDEDMIDFWNRVLYLRRADKALALVTSVDINRLKVPGIEPEALKERIAALRKPFDFEEIITPDGLKKQSEVIGIPVPQELVGDLVKPYDPQGPNFSE